MKFSGKSVLVVGMGVSGQSATTVLERRGAHCSIVDGDYTPNKADGYDLIVVSPGVSQSSPIFEYAAKRGIELIGELELGYILNGNKRVVAITGTNGKTTVTSLVGSILSEKFKTAICGNIGVPFSEVADRGEYDIAVVEVSSFQLLTIKRFHPHIACITNIDCDHLDRHGSMENYARAKLRIAENQTENDYLVMSADSINAGFLKDFSPRAQVLYTSLSREVFGAYRFGDKLKYMSELICNVENVPLIGDFNIANVLSAICICRLLGVDAEMIAEGIAKFETAPHRLKKIRTVGGRSYWDDSKGTNISASLRACGSMSGDTLLIMGGSDKGYDYDTFFENIPPQVKLIAAIGQTANKIAESARKYGFTDITVLSSLAEAVEYANRQDVKNVLLSPASASFDEFENYAHRGEMFIKAVEGLNE